MDLLFFQVRRQSHIRYRSGLHEVRVVPFRYIDARMAQELAGDVDAVVGGNLAAKELAAFVSAFPTLNPA